ncbi:hypothetical protein ACFCXS_33540 [Streptomyces sp. NPDC056373]
MDRTRRMRLAKDAMDRDRDRGRAGPDLDPDARTAHEPGSIG